MGVIIQFRARSCKMGECRDCANLLRIDRDTYKCCAVHRKDGRAVYPIEEGCEHLVDYNCCDGKYFEPSYNRASSK